MKRVVNMQKKVPYVAQLGNMDCSIACMTMLFRYYGLDVDTRFVFSFCIFIGSLYLFLRKNAGGLRIPPAMQV